MARIYPFAAWRYNPSRVRPSDVVTQPYDKINPSLQQAYYQRSPHNLVRIILGLPEMFDDENNNVYTRAAESFHDWQKSGVLLQDRDPCFYAYSQSYDVPGSPGERLERRGFIAIGDVVPYSAGIVFRHERTLARTKSDRLNLLRASRAHFGQIFMLYSDPACTAEKLLFQEDSAPSIEVTDDYGVLHRVWAVSDPVAINVVTATMADKKLIIADGHHRYETALAYSEEKRPENDVPRMPGGVYDAPAYPEAAVMMTLVNMDSTGLTILPTHRVVHGLRDFSAEKFRVACGEFFDIQDIPATQEPVVALRAAPADRVALAAVLKEGSLLLTAKPGQAARALPHLSERQRELDVEQLHSLVLERVLGLSPESIAKQENLSYIRDAAEAIAAVRQGSAQIAMLMRPATLQQLRDVALAGEVMPQKSTDFYPKLLSGLAIYALD